MVYCSKCGGFYPLPEDAFDWFAQGKHELCPCVASELCICRLLDCPLMANVNSTISFIKEQEIQEFYRPVWLSGAAQANRSSTSVLSHSNGTEIHFKNNTTRPYIPSGVI